MRCSSAAAAPNPSAATTASTWSSRSTRCSRRRTKFSSPRPCRAATSPLTRANSSPGRLRRHRRGRPAPDRHSHLTASPWGDGQLCTSRGNLPARPTFRGYGPSVGRAEGCARTGGTWPAVSQDEGRVVEGFEGKVQFVWQVADLLRGDYRPAEPRRDLAAAGAATPGRGARAQQGQGAGDSGPAGGPHEQPGAAAQGRLGTALLQHQSLSSPA